MKFSNDTKTKNIINDTLKNGGIIAFVTDTVWGIGCLPDNEHAVKKIYDIKKRDTSKPLILMSNEVENLLPYVKNVSKRAEHIINKHFPGALTLIFDISEKTPLYITSGKYTVGVRVPDNPIFKNLCEVIDGHVLATTSINISGEAPSLNYETTFNNFSDKVDIIIEDEYYPASGEPSTVAMVNENETKIFRQGKVIL